MKLIHIFCVALIFTVGSCFVEIEIDSELKSAKFATENPLVSDVFEELFGNVSEGGRGGRITNGQPATLGQFPHQALLFMQQGNSWYKCGGSFIRYNWVLTAGHCVFGFSTIKVYGGILNSVNGPASFATDVTAASHKIPHERYNSKTLENDIALLYMANAPRNLFTLNNSIRGVTLPSSSDTNLAAMTGTISGYGKVDDLRDSSTLQWAQAPIITNAACSATYPTIIKNGNVCISTANKRSTCSGDSGGPLTARLRNQNVLVGVTSFGSSRGCLNGLPAGFTRVSYFLGWINSKIGI